MNDLGLTRPAPRSSLAIEELDGELVIYDLDSGFLHRLDPLASIIWSCLDGIGTVEEIVTDLAESFGVERARVEADARALLKRLKAADLLATEGGSVSPVTTETSAASEVPWVPTDPPSP